MTSEISSTRSYAFIFWYFILPFVVVAIVIYLAYIYWAETTPSGKLFTQFKNAAVTSSGLHDEYQKLKNAGEPVTVNQVLGAPIPNEENAVYFLTRAAVYSKINLDRERSDPFESADFLKLAQAVFDAETLAKIKDMEEAELRSSMHDELERFLECQSHRSMFDHMSMSSMFVLTSPMRVLREEAIQSYESKDFESVAVKALQILKIGRIVSYEPGARKLNVAHSDVISGVKLLYVAMANTDLGEKTRQRIDAELEMLNRSDPLVQMVQLDRAKYLECRKTKESIPIQWAFQDQKTMVQWFNHHAALAKDPWYLAWPAHKSGLFDDEYQSCRATFNLYIEAHQFHNRIVSLVRSLMIFHAIQKYEAKNGPTDQIDFKDLGLAEDVGVDPHCGKPMQILRQADGWKVWSTGIPDEGELHYIDWTNMGIIFEQDLIGVGPQDEWFARFVPDKADKDSQ